MEILQVQGPIEQRPHSISIHDGRFGGGPSVGGAPVLIERVFRERYALRRRPARRGHGTRAGGSLCRRSDEYAAAVVARKHDVKQFRQACKEVGLTTRERYEASEVLHADKESSGGKAHMSFGELVSWLREWKRR